MNNLSNGGLVTTCRFGAIERLIRRPHQIFDLMHIESEACNAEARGKPLATRRLLPIRSVGLHRKADPFRLHPSLLQTAGGVAVAYAMSIGAVGLPGQVSYIASIAPICIALGVPTDLLGIFLAVEVVPDIFRTLGNVTGDLAVTSILARGEKSAA